MSHAVASSELDTLFDQAEEASRELTLEDILQLEPDDILWEAKQKRSHKFILLYLSPPKLDDSCDSARALI